MTFRSFRQKWREVGIQRTSKRPCIFKTRMIYYRYKKGDTDRRLILLQC
nr:MAG TPA: hypothetical protein [Bacteriophage sp.]